MKKRLLGTLMTIAMLTTSLMGCSTGNTTSENSQAHGTENMKGKIEVDFWYSGGKTAVRSSRILLMIITNLRINTL